MGYKGQSEPVWGPYLKAPMLWVAGGAEQLSCHDKLMLSYSVGCYGIQLWDVTIYKEHLLLLCYMVFVYFVETLLYSFIYTHF